jgi:hypothetical protein
MGVHRSDAASVLVHPRVHSSGELVAGERFAGGVRRFGADPRPAELVVRFCHVWNLFLG